MHRADPTDLRAARDLLLAYRLAGRMADAIALWETIGSDDSPYWARNAAADAYLARRQRRRRRRCIAASPTQGRRSPALEGIYVAIEQRHFGEREGAAGAGKDPGQELPAEIQRGWLLLFSERAGEAKRLFQSLHDRYPGDAQVRSGLATAEIGQGWPRRGLRGIEEVMARTTFASPAVDNPAARVTRAGALSSLGDVARARREAADLVTLYPENSHASVSARRAHHPGAAVSGGSLHPSAAVWRIVGASGEHPAGNARSRRGGPARAAGGRPSFAWLRPRCLFRRAFLPTWLRASVEVSTDSPSPLGTHSRLVGRSPWSRRPVAARRGFATALGATFP